MAPKKENLETARNDTDDDGLGVKVHPAVDGALGLVLFGLVARYGLFIYKAMDTQPMIPIWVAMSLGFTMAAIWITSAVAHSVGQFISNARVGGNIPQDCANPLASKVAQRKWKDQSWQLAIHVSMGLWEVRLVSQNPKWWEDPATGFNPCPSKATFSDEFILFYIIQLSLWIWTGVSCQFLEERRKDYLEMMIHHILTVALILNSFIHNELAIGMIVLVVHDISDIVLDLMKMANYLKMEGMHGFFITEIMFVLNTYVSWPYLRLYVYPMYVIHGTFIGYNKHCAPRFPGEPLKNFFDSDMPGSYTTASIMLTSLLVLHIFWFYLLNRIAYKMIMGKAPNKAGDDVYEITMKDKKKTKKTN